MKAYEKLLEPITIGTHQWRNRMVKALSLIHISPLRSTCAVARAKKIRTKRNLRLSKQGKAFNNFRIMPTALLFLSSFSSIVRLPHFQVRSALISALLR